MTRSEHYNGCKARGVCVNCVKRPPARGRVRCRACLRKSVKSTLRWSRRHLKIRRALQRHRMESLYWSNPDIYRSKATDRRLLKKINGICQDCPKPCLEDNIRCKRCRDRDRLASRRWDAKRRAQEAKRDALYIPVDVVIDLTRVRVLRAGVRLDWFSASELNEALGYFDNREKNNLTQMLGRLTRAGRFERRDSQAIHNSGSQWEYCITQAGRDELAAVLRGDRRVAIAAGRAA